MDLDSVLAVCFGRRRGKESSIFQFEVVCDNPAHLNQYWKVSALYQFVLDIFHCQVATGAVQ